MPHDLPGAAAPEPFDPSLPGVAYHVHDERPRPSVVQVRVVGDLDYLVAPRLRRHLMGHVGTPTRLLVADLTAVTLLSAAAIDTLLGVTEMAAQESVMLRVVAAGRAVLRPLQLTGVDARLALFPSLAAALADH